MRVGYGITGTGILSVSGGVSVGGGGGCTPVDQIDGAVSQGATFTHPADGVIAFDVDTVQSANVIDVHFRRVDDNNCWRIRLYSTRVLQLTKFVGGVRSDVASSGSGIAVPDGVRVAVVFRGTTITCYIDGSPVFQYTNAVEFQHETGGYVPNKAATAVVSNLKTWSYVCRAEEGIDLPYPDSVALLTADNALTDERINTMAYRDHGIVTFDDYQAACYWDADRYLVIAVRQNDGPWTQYTYDGTGGLPTIQVSTPLDNHNTCVLAFDPDGYLHVTYDHHNDLLNYRRSDAVIGSWSGGLTAELSMLGTNENRVAYPTFTNDPSGKLYFLFRNGGAGSGDTYFYAYDESTQTWSAATGTGTGGLLFDGVNSEPSQNFYHYGAPRFDANFGDGGYMHIAGHWREATGSTNHDGAYVKWDGTNWFQVDGTAQTVPITLANCEIYDPVEKGTGANQGLAGMCGLDSDSSGNPHIVYVRNDSNGYGQIYYAYHDGDEWTVTPLTSQTNYVSAGDAPLTRIHKPEIAIDRSTDTVYVFYPEMGVAGRCIVLLASTAGSGVWTSSTLFDYPVQQVDGLTYDRTLWERDGILDVLVAPYWPTAPTLPLYVVRYEPE